MITPIISTDAQICYGIIFEYGYEFPWDNYDGLPEDWWLDKCGYQKPSKKNINEDYEYLINFKKKYPFPVRLINYCSDEVSMYILAVPSSCLTTSRGIPIIFDPEKMNITDEDQESLINFCEKYCKSDGFVNFNKVKPQWYLSSCWW